MRLKAREAAAIARYKLGAARKAFREAHKHVRISFSQEGEDRILLTHFWGRGPGFYVDVGAHHPHRFSNTQLFYEAGWRGINIDADADAVRRFEVDRPDDVNVCVGVGAASGSTTLYVFSEPAFNTFDQALALERSETIPLLGERLVHVRPLAEILEEHLPAGREISFLNVDVEGRDLEVLESNDWTRYRPEVVLAESPMLSSLEDIADDPVHRFLERAGYAFLAKTINTLIFVRTCSA